MLSALHGLSHLNLHIQFLSICHQGMQFSRLPWWLGGKIIIITIISLSMQETWVRSLGREDSLEKEVVTHSSILAWKIPWTEEPGRLQSVGSRRVRQAERLHFHFSL